MLTITQIPNKKINEVELHKCHSTRQLKRYFDKKHLVRNWNHSCNHRCHYCHVYNFSLCISLPLVWEDLVYFIGTFCSWNCCKQYALHSTPFVFKQCISTIGYFKTILKCCKTNQDIQEELDRRNIQFGIDYEWDYKSSIKYYQTFTHSSHLYSSNDSYKVQPIVYGQKRKKSTLLQLIGN